MVAKRFFSQATRQLGTPRVMTLHGYAASHRAVAKRKYLNNVVEQDHRRIKQRIRPIIGFKRFDTATVTIRGIELAEKIKKNQFNLERLVGKHATAPQTWEAVLAA